MGTQISPDGRIKLAIGEDSGKDVIDDKMVLGSDGSGGWVNDQMDSGEMERTNPPDRCCACSAWTILESFWSLEGADLGRSMGIQTPEHVVDDGDCGRQ